ncbi:MAG: response regulator [Candidatus Zixiibacteriota bacterium]
MSQEQIAKLIQASSERGKPFSVLIVDDEQWVRDVFRDFCETANVFDVELAESGAEAIDKIREKQYDLVTLDIIMPEMSGLETLTRMKRIAPQLPVVVITGNATDKLVNEAGVLGACRVMYKPVRLETFLSEVTSALLKR